MNDEDLISASIALRRKLHDDMKQFWLKHKGVTQEQLFFINSVVLSSIVAQVVHAMFKKDVDPEIWFGYIDRICDFSKKQIVDGSFAANIGIQ